jgi:antitoxin MazE
VRIALFTIESAMQGKKNGDCHGPLPGIYLVYPKNKRRSMVTKVQAWGNSQGLRLSKQVLQEARVAIGDEVEIAVRDNAIIIMPVKRTRRKLSLRRLVARIPKDYRPEETPWGPPAGREIW